MIVDKINQEIGQMEIGELFSTYEINLIEMMRAGHTPGEQTDKETNYRVATARKELLRRFQTNNLGKVHYNEIDKEKCKGCAYMGRYTCTCSIECKKEMPQKEQYSKKRKELIDKNSIIIDMSKTENIDMDEYNRRIKERMEEVAERR